MKYQWRLSHLSQNFIYKFVLYLHITSLMFFINILMHISQTSDKTINSTINPEIKRVIPQTCKLKNPIPTTQNKSSSTSCNSLFNWCQFFWDLILWASLFSVIIMIVNVHHLVILALDFLFI